MLLIRMIGFPALAICAVLGLAYGNWVPLAILVIAVGLLAVAQDALGIHPQRAPRTGHKIK